MSKCDGMIFFEILCILNNDKNGGKSWTFGLKFKLKLGEKVEYLLLNNKDN